MRAGALIYMEKGVAAPAPETNQKWLERTREGAHVFATYSKGCEISQE
jgi:hypothetical protein